MASPPRPSRLYLVVGALKHEAWWVAYGPAIDVRDLAELPNGEAAVIATERLAEAIRELERRVA